MPPKPRYRRSWQTQILWAERCVGVIVFLLLFVGFLQNCTDFSMNPFPLPSNTHAIHIDKQVSVGNFDGRVTSIAKSSAGGSLVTGYSNTGWVVATDAQGKLLWKYLAPPAKSVVPTNPPVSHSEYHSVVPLANGNVLLCGESATTAHHSVALLTFLNERGELIEERQEFTNEDRDYTASSISRCLRWNGGVAVLGGTKDASGQSFVWLMRLDDKGVKLWQKPLPAGTWVGDAASLAAGGLALANIQSEPKTTGFSLHDYNEHAEIVAIDGPIAGKFPYFLRPAADDSGLALLAYFDLSNTTQLHSLDDRLVQTASPIQVAMVDFDIQEGFGYRLRDQSILLFGHTATPSGARGSVEWIGKRGEYLARSLFPPGSESLSIGDAIPVADHQFVVAGVPNSTASGIKGLFLTWISLK